VVIDIVQVKRIAFVEPKDHSPIGSDNHCPKASQLALSRMQTEAWQVHISNRAGGVKTSQDIAQFVDVLCQNTSGVVVFIETLQALVAERSDRWVS
jgi:hypothetical protein